MSHSASVPDTEGELGPQARPSRPAQLAAWMGITFHMLLGVLYLLSGLLAPFWAVVVLWTLWTGLLAVTIHQRTRRPILVAVVPIVGLVAWAVAMWAGFVLLDWIA